MSLKANIINNIAIYPKLTFDIRDKLHISLIISLTVFILLSIISTSILILPAYGFKVSIHNLITKAALSFPNDKYLKQIDSGHNVADISLHQFDSSFVSSSYRYSTYNIMKIIPVSCIQKNLLNFAQNECTGATTPPPPPTAPPPSSNFCAQKGHPDWSWIHLEDKHGKIIEQFCLPPKPKPAPEPTCDDLKKQQQDNLDKINKLEQQLDKLKESAKNLQNQINDDIVNIGFELDQTADQLKKVFGGPAFGPGYEEQLKLALLDNPAYKKLKAQEESHIDQRKEIVKQFDEGVEQWKDLIKQKNELNNKLKDNGCPNK